MSTQTPLHRRTSRFALAIAALAPLAIASVSGAQCGTNPASCYTTHVSSSGCNDAFCCNLVCEEVPSCCTLGWDALCVDVAQTFCGAGDPMSESVLSPIDGRLYLLCYPGTFTQQSNQGPDVGALTSIHDRIQNEWIRRTMLATAPGVTTARIGLNDKTTEGVYVWSDASPVDFLNWAPGQPSGSGSLDSVQMDPTTGRWSEVSLSLAVPGVYRWSHSHCGQNGSCFQVGFAPRCSDVTCCNEVCAFDTYCCDMSWDDSCAGAANDLCQPAVVLGPIVNPSNGHSYYITSPGSWTFAEKIARSMKGHLATIQNSAENTWVLANLAAAALGDPARIGLTDRRTETKYEWVSGEQSTYTKWAAGSPGPYTSGRDWAAMTVEINGTWIDATSSESFPAVIEVPCLGDLNGDKSVGAPDLAILLGAWGTLPSVADLDFDGDVDATDMSILLGGWGPCPTSNACTAHATPKSDQPGCNGCVCAFDPTCCQVAWDADCVSLAAGQCKAACQCGG